MNRYLDITDVATTIQMTDEVFSDIILSWTRISDSPSLIKIFAGKKKTKILDSNFYMLSDERSNEVKKPMLHSMKIRRPAVNEFDTYLESVQIAQNKTKRNNRINRMVKEHRRNPLAHLNKSKDNKKALEPKTIGQILSEMVAGK